MDIRNRIREAVDDGLTEIAESSDYDTALDELVIKIEDLVKSEVISEVKNLLSQFIDRINPTGNITVLSGEGVTESNERDRG